MISRIRLSDDSEYQNSSSGDPTPQLSLSNKTILLIGIFFFCVLLTVYGVISVSLQKELFTGSETYTQIAADLINIGHFTTAYRPPLYPITIAGLMVIAPTHYPVLTLLFQVFCGLVCGLLLYKIVLRIGGDEKAAALCLALYVCHVLFQIEVLAKRETVIFTVVVLWWFLSLIKPNRSPVSLGLSTGIAHMLRPTGMLLFFSSLIVLLSDLNTSSRISKVKEILIATAVFSMTVAPWQFNLYQLTGNIQLNSSITGPHGFWKGNNPYFDTIYPYVDVDRLEPMMYALAHSDTQAVRAQNIELNRLAMQFCLDDPLAFIRRTITKIFVYICPYPTPFGKADLVFTDDTVVLKDYQSRNIYISVYATLFMLTCYIGLSKAFSLCRSPEMPHLKPLIFFVLVFILFATTHSLSFAETRYRLPLDILMLPFASIGLRVYMTRSMNH